MKVVSLFSGIGGLDKGFEEEGYQIIWANDFDSFAVQTYKANFNNEIICDDINNIPLDNIPDFDVLIGGFPCQPFSLMGAQKGFEETRGTLFFKIAEIIKDKIDKNKKPRVIVLENVRALKTHNKGNTYKTIYNILTNELGYKVFFNILNTADYGIPQTRNRAYIVCFANPKADFQYPKKQELKITMPELLEKTVDNKYYLTNKIKKTILSDGKGGFVAKSEINLKVARPLCATMAKMHRACQDNYVSDSGVKIADIQNVDEERIRRLTPRECARLQGFDDSFKIVVSDSQAHKQFGNAVTVSVSKAVAKSVKDSLMNLGEWV